MPRCGRSVRSPAVRIQIHLAIKDAITDRGTLMMYARLPGYYDDIGRGVYPGSVEREILDKMPPFDAATARAARDNGTLVEFFRSYPGSLVNDHVARFVVWGRKAEHLISEQPWDFAFGRGSALERFVEADGKICLIGCDHDTVTFLHYAEHILDVPGLRIVTMEVPVDRGRQTGLEGSEGSRYQRRWRIPTGRTASSRRSSTPIWRSPIAAAASTRTS